jgi:head-tail adaptor
MSRAGQYPHRVQVLVRTSTTNALGEVVESFTPTQFLWCRIEEDSPRRAGEYGGNQTGIEGTISLRNYPAITTLDMLRDGYDRTWKIEGKTTGSNEVILNVYTDDSLTDWTEEGS